MQPLTPVPAHVPSHLVRDFNFFHVQPIDGDIHAGWRRLLDEPPLFWTPHNGGHWVATRASDIEAMFKDFEHFSSREATIPSEGKPVPLPLLEIDPPGHNAWRQLIIPLFTPKAIGELGVFARQLTIELIESFKDRGECEFIEEFSQHMPIGIFLRMADLPFEDRAWLLPHADLVTRSDDVDAQRAAYVEILGYVSEKLEHRRGKDGRDLLSLIANGQVDGKAIPHDEAVALASLVMFAGLDTVVAMLGHFMRHLALHPEHRRMIASGEVPIRNAMEELLRRHGVTQMGRVVAKDHDYNGVHLRVGDTMMLPTLLYGLDEAKFPHAMEVDFSRQNNFHLAFGAGAHRCIGSVLARTELQILLEEWLPRIPEFSIKPGAQIEVKAGKVNAISHLPLVWPV